MLIREMNALGCARKLHDSQRREKISRSNTLVTGFVCAH